MAHISPEAAPAAGAALRLAAVAGSKITYTNLPPNGSVTLGRDDGCDIRIRDRSVSRRHAVLHMGPPLRIEDLGSANGTYVCELRRGAPAGHTNPLRRLSRQSAELVIGERVNLGTTTIVVCRAPADEAGEPPGRDGGPGGSVDIVIADPAMRALHDQAARAARSTLSVLLLGETGVGKEVLARTVHACSPRASGPYLELHCASLPASLLEGELFGHEKSAFTGANEARSGLLESADGGTVFLDEIGELPLAFQVKLLRVLEDRKVLRVGGRTPRKIDVRFVAATNRNLEVEIARGAFRQDLYFRLNGVTLVIPPLRERPLDIAPLARKLLARACWQLDQSTPPALSREAIAALEAYAWPGNVRELRNVIERAAVFCAGDVISTSDLPAHLTGGPASQIADSGPPGRPDPPSDHGDSASRFGDRATPAPPSPQEHAARLKQELKVVERQRILDALEQSAGNQTRAAKALGMSLRTLINRINEYGIPRPRKKS